MGWGLTRWIVSVRAVQLMGSFIPGALNGWLIYFIYTKELGLAQTMVILQILITLVFFYTLLSLLVTNGYKGSKQAAWVTGNICFDVVFCFFPVAIISILAYTGLPLNCSGLSRAVPVDPANDEASLLERKGFTTTGFSSDPGRNKGTLDQYCGMERAFYFIALCIILSYIITIILLVMRVCQLRMHAEDARRGRLRREHEEAMMQHKMLQDEEAPASPTPARHSSRERPPAASIRPGAHPHGPAYHTTPPTPGRPARPGLRYADRPVPIPGPSSSAPPSPPAHHHRPRQPPPPLEPVSPLSPIPSPSPSPSPSAGGALPHDRGFILSPTDVSANLAMVADGPRYTPHHHHRLQGAGGADNNNNNNNNNGGLPPYSPGNNMRAVMRGHGSESNDIRLSEYVKGATAAQDMKDADGF